jgi:hypothetical protein
MGVVYQARQTTLGRTVALKMILAGRHSGVDDLARFRREAEAIARLQHPNIVQIHEVGEQDGQPFFCLEFCPGGSLERKLAGTPLRAPEAAALVEALARAVYSAHERGVVHRDLKPANVLLAEDGTPKITDFGLAKKLDPASPGQQSREQLTATGAVLGTPSYMAPEQAGGKKDVGPAADIYALGAILYECLTGRPPFKGATPLDTILQVISEEPVPPTRLNAQVPRDLETICLKCLQKEPSGRYARALDLAEDLHRFSVGEPVRARPVGRVERAWKWARRNPVVASLAAAVAVLFLTGLPGVTWQWRRAVAEWEESQRLLASASYDRGQALCEQGDTSRGVLWLVRTLRLAAETDPDLERATRANLAVWVRGLPVKRGVLDHGAIEKQTIAVNLEAIRGNEIMNSRSEDGCRVAFSPDGRRILTWGSLPFLWDASTGQVIGPPLYDPRKNEASYNVNFIAFDSNLLGVGFNSDSKTVLTVGRDGGVWLWDTETGKVLRHEGPRPEENRPPWDREWRAVALSPDAKTVLVGRRIWKIGQPMPREDTLPEKASASGAVQPEGRPCGHHRPGRPGVALGHEDVEAVGRTAAPRGSGVRRRLQPRWALARDGGLG